MSKTQNDIYLEGKVEDFDYMIARGNWAGAKQIAQEMNEKGFTVASQRLEIELANKKLHTYD